MFESLMQKELFEAPEVVKSAVALCASVSQEVARECAKRNVRRVILAGRGSSLHAGIAFKFMLESKTPYVLSFEYPSIVTLFNAQRDLSDTLYVVVSQSGAGPDTLAFARAAKLQNALTVAVTAYADSPLAHACDYVLDIASGEEKAVAATKTLTGEIVALETLAFALAGQKFDVDLIDGLHAVLSRELPQITPQLTSAQKVIILSRGMTEAVAKECGLKLMETCYLINYSASTNEFQHGPKALLTNGVPVILFAPDGANRDGYIQSATDLKANGAYLVVFSDIEEVIAQADYAFSMPALSSDQQTVTYLVAMQRFVASLCHSLGLNPDSPRNLHKVTITN